MPVMSVQRAPAHRAPLLNHPAILPQRKALWAALGVTGPLADMASVVEQSP